MANVYVKSGAGAIELSNRTWSLGEKMVPAISDTSSNYAYGRSWVWEVTTAGTSTGTPAWPSSITQDVTTVTQNGVVWTARRPGYSSGTTADWSYATPFLLYAITHLANYFSASAENIYVSDNHNEAFTAAISTSSPFQYQVLCVDDSAAPPTALATGAVVATSGGYNLAVGSVTSAQPYFYGITFQCGVGSAASLSLHVNGICENCRLELASTNAGCTMQLINARLLNCTLKFAHSSQRITSTGMATIFGGSLDAAGSKPAALFSAMYNVTMFGFDWSGGATTDDVEAWGNGFALAATCRLFGVDFPASWAGTLTSNSRTYTQNQITAVECSDDSTNYPFLESNGEATMVDETTIVPSGQTQSIKTTATANQTAGSIWCQLPDVFLHNETTGSPVTLTWDILRDSATNLKDSEVWMEVCYHGASGSQLATYSSTRCGAMTAASDLAASSTAWTTTGMSNPNAQKVSVTFTPQKAGKIWARLCICKAGAVIYSSYAPTVS